MDAIPSKEPRRLRYLEDFLLHLEHGRASSPHTLSSYRSDLARFGRSLSPRKAANPGIITTPELKGYLTGLLLEDLERATVARHAASLRAFFRYLMAEGFVEHDPAASLRMPRRKRNLPRPLTREQVGRLLAAPVGDDFVAARDGALLETLYSAGLRVSELVALDASDLDLSHGVVKVMGKGRRERIGMLGTHAVGSLERYLPRRARRLKPTEGDPLFLNRSGTRLSDRSVRRTLKRYIIVADLPDSVTPHTLRHSFASHLIENGAGLKEVQEMLGHLHLSSTQIYTQVSPEHLRRVYEQAHPRA